MENFLVDLLKLVIAVVIVLVVNNYLPSFASAKGKNKADLKDIPKLTKAVEQIKKDINDENEKLRQKLDVMSASQNEVNKAELDTIFKIIDVANSSTVYLRSFKITEILNRKNCLRDLEVALDNLHMELEKIPLEYYRYHLKLYVFMAPEEKVINTSNGTFVILANSINELCKICTEMIKISTEFTTNNAMRYENYEESVEFSCDLMSTPDFSKNAKKIVSDALNYSKHVDEMIMMLLNDVREYLENTVKN
ncbi:hypothetical protein EZV73_26675 [Acidaminobacter sp. JC074]|uniref:hypothetical protein n=1 Tax=Acidaminobacter sp. JC074 TaxID=2530199 RepID=UPI001F105615|nr:hypothetical protein [Acidaminobacter sp. JC074]MCH4891192.1 hypothetical protein [Acidaminobacter sp. JC074]